MGVRSPVQLIIDRIRLICTVCIIFIRYRSIFIDLRIRPQHADDDDVMPYTLQFCRHADGYICRVVRENFKFKHQTINDRQLTSYLEHVSFNLFKNKNRMTIDFGRVLFVCLFFALFLFKLELDVHH